MPLQVEQQGDWGKIILPEKVVAFGGVEDFKQALNSLFNQGCRVIQLDFSHLVMLDTSGLSQILVFQNRLRERGGRLEIININSKYIRKMFVAIELFKVVEIEGVK